jgi:hypothetical protein
MATTNVLQIHTLSFSVLPNDTHYEFFSTENSELTQAGTEVKSALSELIPDFNKWFAEEQANLDNVRKSNLTAAIADAARTLNRYQTGLFETVNGAATVSTRPLSKPPNASILCLKTTE